MITIVHSTKKRALVKVRAVTNLIRESSSWKGAQKSILIKIGSRIDAYLAPTEPTGQLF